MTRIHYSVNGDPKLEREIPRDEHMTNISLHAGVVNIHRRVSPLPAVGVFESDSRSCSIAFTRQLFDKYKSHILRRERKRNLKANINFWVETFNQELIMIEDLRLLKANKKWYTMLAEINMEKTFSKKVSSELSFRRSQESQKEKFLHTSGLSEKKSSSKSLNDLCNQLAYELSSSKRSDSFLQTEKCKYGDGSVTAAFGCNYSNKLARRCVANLMMLNAWRRQKTGYREALEKMENLSNKIESFEMQVYVLRQLLSAEKKRVEATNENVHNLLQKIKKCEDEKASLVAEKENMARDFNQMLVHCSQMESTLKNQENTIITSKAEIENWEKQLKKEREKLKKMETEEIWLREKIQLVEKALKLNTHQIEQLTEANKELQHKLDVQVPLWDETMAQVDLANARVKEAEERKSDLEKVLEDKEKEIKELKAAIALLERRLREEDERNGLLGKSILEKSNELSLIQKKLLELSKSSYPWSAGMIKAASFCAKIPVACICTVGSLLLPFPSYRF